MADEKVQNINEWGEENRAELEKLTGDRGEFTIPRVVLETTPSDMFAAFADAMYLRMVELGCDLSHHHNVEDGSVTMRWYPKTPETFKGIQQR